MANESLLTKAYHLFLETKALTDLIPSADPHDPTPSIITIPHQDPSVKAVVVGGFAVLLHGGPRKDTPDIDFALIDTAQEYGLEKTFKSLTKSHADQYEKDKATGNYYLKFDKGKVGVDWIRVGKDWIRKPLYAEKIQGIWVATVPNLAILKAKSLSPLSKRTAEQKANDMKDYKFLLKKMVDNHQQFPEELKWGGFWLWNALDDVPDNKEARGYLEKVGPWEKKAEY